MEKYQIRAFMDRSAKKWIKNEKVSFSDDAKEMANVDLVFVVGGDGTILRAAKRAVVYDKPILGINAGRLGFLSDIETEDLPVIEKLIKTGCPIERRMALKVSVGEQSFYAVNDVYVTKTEPGKISELFVECDNREVCRYRADGIVLATPEGSTAYSMSAGGPVLDTKLNAIIMTPV
ncbi:MAG: NAD(+)/NADH kinase, partial [Clostridia bacterium]|nr:NAD(+)/NADH kinase [Clostridia bacterium]